MYYLIWSFFERMKFVRNLYTMSCVMLLVSGLVLTLVSLMQGTSCAKEQGN